MIWHIIEAVNVSFEILIIYLYFMSLCDPKRELEKYLILGHILAGAILFFVGTVTASQVILISVTFIILVSISKIFYKISLEQCLFFSFMFIAIIFISEILLISIITLLDDGFPREVVQQGPLRLMGMIGSKITHFWLSSYTCRLVKKRSFELSVKQWILTILTPIFSVLILTIINKQLLFTVSDREVVLYSMAVIGLLYLNWSVFDFVESYSMKVRIELLEQVIEHEENNYKMLNNSYKNLRQLRHDIGNQLIVMRYLLEKGDRTSVEKQLDILGAELLKNKVVNYSGDPYIDSILNVKSKLANKHNISFGVHYFVGELKLDTISLMRILGNALDNAIEECVELTDKNRYINISILQSGNKLSISIKNSSRPVDTNRMITRKENKLAHGIGLKSMQEAAEKLSGTIKFTYRDNEFSINLVLYNG